MSHDDPDINTEAALGRALSIIEVVRQALPMDDLAARAAARLAVNRRSRKLNPPKFTSSHHGPAAEALAWAELGPTRWLRAWYEVVRAMPSAGACDADLVIVGVSLQSGDRELVGMYDTIANRISVAAAPIPASMLATLVHEVAHYAANQRHGKIHGYSWRRAFAALLEEVTGVADVEAKAEHWRRVHGYRWAPRPSREHALDVLAEQILGWTSLTLGDGVIVVQTPIHAVGVPR